MPRLDKVNRRYVLKKLVFGVIVLAGTVWLFLNFNRGKRYISRILEPKERKPLTVVEIVKRTQNNYGEDIEKLAREFNVPSNYLKALIVLEVGGRKPAPTRFEKGVFQKLKLVKEGKRKRYEKVKKKTIANASEDALKNLATSWGAFQIMGYKCVQLGVNVSDIRGERSLYWGVKWISEEYGKYLRKGKFKDGFHIHNAGSKYPRNGKPRTYHADYVPNGLKYMDMFDQIS
ncbi:MAG: hypothetical protein HKN39_06255 [Flavobacteriales bacterium]|nr:hypothetical protein [Flavobacteriales bacterium]